MAITSGAGSGSGYGIFYVGIDQTISGFDIEWDYYVRTNANSVYDNQTLTVTGARSATFNFRMTTCCGAWQYVGTVKMTGNPGGSYTTRASLSGVYSGATPSHSRTATLGTGHPSTPARPTFSDIESNSAVMRAYPPSSNGGSPIKTYKRQIADNAAFNPVLTTWESGASNFKITGLAAATTYYVRYLAINNANNGSAWSPVGTFTTGAEEPLPIETVSATRVNDSRIDLSWASPGTGTRPVQGVHIQRSTDGGAYVDVANLTGDVTAWSDAGVEAGHAYRYRVRVWNRPGSIYQYSPTTYSGNVYTSPGAPKNVYAYRDGDAIVVEFENGANYPISSYRIEDSRGGGEYTFIGTTTTSPYLIANPTRESHQYRVIAVSPNGLRSAPSVPSNIVYIPAPPYAPTVTQITPQDAAKGIRVPFTHNPADGSRQQRYEVRYRQGGMFTWTSSGVQAGAASEYTVPANALSNSDPSTARYTDVQVRTWGSFTDPSPWSAITRIDLYSTPTITGLSPSNGGEFDSSNLTIRLTPQDGTGLRIVEISYKLTNRDTGQVFERVDTTSRVPGNQVTTTGLGGRLENGSRWRLEVTVKNSVGLKSAVYTSDFTVVYPPPNKATLEATWDELRGAVQLESYIDNGDPYAPEIIDTELQRSIDDGETWQTVGFIRGESGVTLDARAPVFGRVCYRAITNSALPSSNTSDVVCLDFADGTARCATGDIPVLSAYINFGPNLGQVVRLYFDLDIGTETFDIEEQVLHRFSGRTFPTLYTGTAMDQTFTVTFSTPHPRLQDQAASLDEIKSMRIAPGPKLWRDYQGRFIFVAITKMSYESAPGGIFRVTLEATRVDPPAVPHV